MCLWTTSSKRMKDGEKKFVFKLAINKQFQLKNCAANTHTRGEKKKERLHHKIHVHG